MSSRTGRAPTGQRYCMNGVSLAFQPEGRRLTTMTGDGGSTAARILRRWTFGAAPMIVRPKPPRTFPVRLHPLLLALALLAAPGAARADLLYVLNSGDASVSLVDATTRQEIRRIPCCGSPPPVLTPDGAPSWWSPIRAATS